CSPRCSTLFPYTTLFRSLPLLLGFVLPPLAQASLSAARASFNDAPLHGAARLKRRLLTAALHLLQPLARLRGRLQYGLAPWRRRSEEHTSELQSRFDLVC